jgi:hypothetical protein
MTSILDLVVRSRRRDFTTLTLILYTHILIPTKPTRLSRILHPTPMSQDLIHRQPSCRIHVHHTRDQVQRIWTKFLSPRLELQTRIFFDCFLSVS